MCLRECVHRQCDSLVQVSPNQLVKPPVSQSISPSCSSRLHGLCLSGPTGEGGASLCAVVTSTCPRKNQSAQRYPCACSPGARASQRPRDNHAAACEVPGSTSIAGL